jgi:predicted RNA-binding Zn-ribbon protein involved in translation (DUF1610 family)
MSGEANPGKPGSNGGSSKDARPAAVGAGIVDGNSSQNVDSPKSAPATATPAKIPWPTMPAAETKPEATYKCPKCGTNAREVARFCPRCHTTLRFECPSCGNRQRTSGKCEKCGVDFLKYVGAVVAGKKAEADAIHDRLDRRSSFLRAVALVPINGGWSLFRYFLKRNRS